jgi:beta-lactamase class D
MQNLMEATIQFGTCRKSFRARKQDSRLRTVVFGGKTGNINNKTDTIKYDWFLGYGKTESGSHELALSVMMVHGRLLGHRANVMAYDLFKRYFRQKKG